MEPPCTPIVRKITRAQNINEPLGPIVCKVVGEVVAKPKRSFSHPIEVWRDFLYGFPYNWEDYVTSSDKESISVDPKEFSECFVPAALEACNGAQLHGLVLSLTDAERDLFNKKVSEDLIGMLNLQNQGDADVNNFETPKKYSGLASKKEAVLSKEDPSIAIAAPQLV